MESDGRDLLRTGETDIRFRYHNVAILSLHVRTKIWSVSYLIFEGWMFRGHRNPFMVSTKPGDVYSMMPSKRWVAMSGCPDVSSYDERSIFRHFCDGD